MPVLSTSLMHALILIQTVMNQLVEKHLQGDKSITKQAPARLAIYYEEVRSSSVSRYEMLTR